MLSFYGIFVIVHRFKTEIIEAIEFDNLQDWYIVGEAPDKTDLAIKIVM